MNATHDKRAHLEFVKDARDIGALLSSDEKKDQNRLKRSPASMGDLGMLQWSRIELEWDICVVDLLQKDVRLDYFFNRMCKLDQRQSMNMTYDKSHTRIYPRMHDIVKHLCFLMVERLEYARTNLECMGDLGMPNWPPIHMHLGRCFNETHTQLIDFGKAQLNKTAMTHSRVKKFGKCILLEKQWRNVTIYKINRKHDKHDDIWEAVQNIECGVSAGFRYEGDVWVHWMWTFPVKLIVGAWKCMQSKK